MITAVLDNQLMITVHNKVGVLAEITEIIANSGINLLAVCAYAVSDKGFIMFVTEDNKKAKELLIKNNFEVREEEVVVASLGNKPGALQTLCDQVANAGIDLTLLYGSVEKSGKSTRLVFVSEDNQGVLSVIRMMK